MKLEVWVLVGRKGRECLRGLPEVLGGSRGVTRGSRIPTDFKVFVGFFVDFFIRAVLGSSGFFLRDRSFVPGSFLALLWPAEGLWRPKTANIDENRKIVRTSVSFRGASGDRPGFLAHGQFLQVLSLLVDHDLGL